MTNQFKLFLFGLMCLQILSCQVSQSDKKVPNDLTELNCQLIKICMRDSSAYSEEKYPFTIVNRISLEKKSLFLAQNLNRLPITQIEKEHIKELFYRSGLESVEIFGAHKIFYVEKKTTNYFGFKKQLFVFEGVAKCCDNLECWSWEKVKKAY